MRFSKGGKVCVWHVNTERAELQTAIIIAVTRQSIRYQFADGSIGSSDKAGCWKWVDGIKTTRLPQPRKHEKMYVQL